MAESTQGKPNKKPDYLSWFYGIFIVLVILWFYGKSLETPLTAREQYIKKCFEYYHASVPNLVDYVKERLRDPSSFEHIQTKYRDDGTDNLRVRMQYRAKNGFGGTNNETVSAIVQISTCNVLSAE
ncbi:hypothetical protein HNQ68_003159 [Pseudochrobactrum saccharolyticum]|uniref:Uncharacterized protein n=1 Tax=Pseudochrobactrum saccharolyticum TaxID=354352 RepID=A0A7W8ALK6_9HYPH|nr:hypothetical protein [Pseudochrobactrum saccharolyticum]KAB0537048.1 hypothetical protein F7P81_16610 [Pseudochrobactrum saccharolyticum]MBB5092602.1 hypothetical protein [Pseudochrobactrum saccharolyticum]